VCRKADHTNLDRLRKDPVATSSFSTNQEQTMPQNHRPQGPPPRHPENMINITGNSGLGSARSAGPPIGTSASVDVRNLVLGVS